MSDFDVLETDLRETLRRAAIDVPPEVAVTLTVGLRVAAPRRGLRNRASLVGVAAALAALVLASAAVLPGLLIGDPDATEGRSTHASSPTPEATVEVSGVTLQGDAVSAGDFVGRPLVIFIWGSWCAPCREVADELSDWSNATGTAVLGVDSHDTRASGSAFEESRQIDYPSLFDPGGRILNSLGVDSSRESVPLTLVLDANGIVRERIVGQFRVQRELSRALAGLR